MFVVVCAGRKKRRASEWVKWMMYMGIGRLVGSCVAGSALTGIMPSQDFLETWFAPVRDLRQLQARARHVDTVNLISWLKAGEIEHEPWPLH